MAGARTSSPGAGWRLCLRRSPGDVIFDLEGHPFFEPARGLEYLFGILLIDGAEPRYQPFWAHDRDRASAERSRHWSISFMPGSTEYPDLHVYHFSGTEPSTLKRLMAEHVTREAQVDDLLRRQVFVDLHTIVRRALRAGVSSYSLKHLEALFGFTRTGAVQSGTQAILTYERWLHQRSQSLLDEIEAYNREDCRATLGLLGVAAPDPPGRSPLAGARPSRSRSRPRPPRCSTPGSGCVRSSSREPSPGRPAGLRVSCWTITGARLALPGGPTSIASASRRKSCWKIRRPSPTSRSIEARRPSRGSGRWSMP